MTPSTFILDVSFMAMLVVVAFAIIRMRSLFAVVMLQGVYSLVCAAWFVSLDAVDVAFTEAAVGAGVSTVLMLAAMLLADRESKPVPIGRQLGPLIIVICAGLALFYALGDMPAYGDQHSPANSYVGMDYIERTADDIHIPNVVTAVLASYRGYDTFGEAVVIFSAGLGVLLLLGLNGNAGKWRAKHTGPRLYRPSAPAARIKPTPPAEKPAPVKKPATRRKTSTAKTTTTKNTTAKNTTAKKTTAKKPAAKKPAAKKPAAKKTTTRKPAAKKPATRRKTTTKKGSTS